jgi:hypothetical protein
MTSLATLPVLAVPGRQTSVSFALSGVGANFIRAWVSEAPAGGSWDAKLKGEASHRAIFYEGPGGANAPVTDTFDRGGAYTVITQEYTKGASAYGGGYQGAPASAPSETKVGVESTLTLNVGQRMTSRIGVGVDTATLVLWCWGDTIRTTRAAYQGEDSPTIAETRSPRALAAASASTVASALAALADQPVATAIGNVATVAENLRARSRAHMTGTGWHENTDAVNPLPASYATDQSLANLPKFVSSLLESYRRHLNNYRAPVDAAEDPSGFGLGNYHVVSSEQRADFTSVPLYQSAGTIEDAYPALADLWRVHEAHRVNLSVHASADTTALTALPPVLAVHREFLKVLASPVVVPPGQTSGAMFLSAHGFSET